MKVDVIFYAGHAFHLSIFNEVAKNLKGENTLTTFSVEQVNFLEPKVLVLADHSYGLFSKLDRYITVQLTHGYSDKNNTYHPDHTMADYICVCGNFQKHEFEKKGIRPKKDFWRTGYPPLDPLFRNDPAKRLPPKLRPGRLTILYAPTWNMELNSVTQIGDRIAHIIHSVDPEANLVIKPHPASASNNPEWMATWRKMAADPRVYFEENASANIIPLMMASDMMITDVSAVSFQYLALNRPIFLFNTDHPGKESSYSYSPDGIEWRFRDLGYQFETPDELCRHIELILSGQDPKRETRIKYARLLYEDLTDGKAGERIADNIKKVL